MSKAEPTITPQEKEQHDEIHSLIVSNAIEKNHDIALCGVCHRVVFLKFPSKSLVKAETVSVQ